MASRKFPVTLEHSKVKGTTTANSEAKLKRYQARGWKIKSKTSTSGSGS